VAFGIARTALGLSRAASVLSAVLVLLSPAVLASSLTDLSLASESLASALVGCGCLAVLARRDWLCAALLLIALLTKETAAWAPFAAAVTVLLRPEREGRPRRLLAAVLVLAPVVFWLGLRLAFYGGIGGSYATAYWPLAGFLRLTLWKLTHLDHLFVMQEIPATEGRWAPADLVFRIGAAALVFLLLIPWALTGLRSAMGWVTARERRWPAADGALLVTLWAGMGLGFHFALALSNPSYASAAVVFAWPAVVAEVARRGPMLRLGLAACSVLSLAQMSHFLGVSTQLWGQGPTTSIFDAVRAMNAALNQIPTEIKQVYVLSAGGLVPANPDYVRALLGENAEIIRIADVEWNCSDAAEHVVFDHDSIGGVVTLDAAVPKCGRFFFAVPQIGASALVDGQIRRNAWFSYELPEARLEERAEPTDLSLEPGRRVIVHVRTRGPARFIIERGRADGGIAWFDTP
jgi:hypothetical protein